MSLGDLRITERANPLTSRLDEASPGQIIDLLGTAESQIFGSTAWGQGCFEPEFLKQLQRARELIDKVGRHPHGRIILSGAGTSGRLAVYTAAVFAKSWTAGRLTGMMAGGLEAFFRAKEGVEDLPAAGRADLEAAVPGDGPYVLIGISCGLSAAYLAGQLQACLAGNRGHAVIIGFNPLADANRRPLTSGRSFYGLLTSMLERERGILLNPILGPEPITGSTRMKGGTATKLILDGLFSSLDARVLFEHYERWREFCFAEMGHLIPIMERAAECLRKKRGLVYLAGERDAFMALLDASECPPTFGCDPDQVRAFTTPGFRRLLAHPVFDAAIFDPAVSGELERTMPAHLGAGTPAETAPFAALLHGRKAAPLLPEALARSARSRARSLPPPLHRSCRDLALKWILNSLSSGAFILSGKVFGNTMIDLRISNHKLWERALSIVATLAEVSTERAQDKLNQSIDFSPPVAEVPMPAAAVQAFIKKASGRTGVVPRAIVLARTDLNAAETDAMLTRFPKLKTCLETLGC